MPPDGSRTQYSPSHIEETRHLRVLCTRVLLVVPYETSAQRWGLDLHGRPSAYRARHFPGSAQVGTYREVVCGRLRRDSRSSERQRKKGSILGVYMVELARENADVGRVQLALVSTLVLVRRSAFFSTCSQTLYFSEPSARGLSEKYGVLGLRASGKEC